jgi:gas vesicle protein
MANDNNIGGATIMVAFAIGALTGAAVALLFAPASGEETREYLAQKAKEGRAKAREAVDEGRAFYQDQREGLASAIERGREAFQEARDLSTGSRSPRAESKGEGGGQQA